MKKILPGLLLAACLSAPAATVIFNLTDILQGTQGLTRRTMVIEPRGTPKGHVPGNLVVTSERRFMPTGSNAVVTATNMIDGIYRIQVWGISYTSVFRILIPTTNGTINASDYIISANDNGLDLQNGRPLELQ